MAIRTSIPSRPLTSLLFLAFVLGFTFFAPSPSLSPSSSSILPHLLQVVGQTTTVGGSVDHPNTPADGASAVQHECLLDEIAFTGGLKIQGSFQSNKFHYQLQCDEVQFPSPRVTIVRPHTVDYGSSAEVTFNDEHINFRTTKNAISNGGDNNQAPNSPLFESYPLTFRSGANTITVGVGCNMRALPNPCYYQYHFECKPKGNGTSIIGDPQFIGLRGQNYQVHGVSGEVYNIVSDADLQYNSRFVFLTEGSCPVVNGKRQKGCFSHSGSYLGELGLKTRSGDKIHLVSGTAKAGFETIQVNSKDLQVGDTIFLADNLGSVSRNSTHMASVTVGSWNFVFENSDMFINQHVYVAKEVMANLRSHGLLGQTWSDATYPNPIKYIQGYVDDYVIRENDVFGDNFVYNHFN